jgi:hypothetical protein
MIVDIAAFRHLLDVIEVITVELVKINFRRDIVELSTDEVIDPHDMMPFGNHSAIIASAKWLPRKPATPVTNTFIVDPFPVSTLFHTAVYAQSESVAFAKKIFPFRADAQRIHLSGVPTLPGRAKKRRSLIGALQKDFRSRSLSGSHEPGHSRFPAHAGPPSAEADRERAPRVKAKQKFQGLE